MMTIRRTYRDQHCPEFDEPKMGFYHVFDAAGKQLDQLGFRYKREAQQFQRILEAADAARGKGRMKSFEIWQHTEDASVCICKRWEDEVKAEYRDMNPGDTRTISADDQKIVHIDCVQVR